MFNFIKQLFNTYRAINLDKKITKLVEQNKYAEVIAVTEKFLHYCDALHVTDIYVAMTYSVLANCCFFVSSRYFESEIYHSKALEIYEKHSGCEKQIALACSALGLIYNGKGEYDKSEMFLQRAVSIVEKVFGPDNPKVLIHINSLLNIKLFLAKLSEAEILFRRAIKITMAIMSDSKAPDRVGVAYGSRGLAEMGFSFGFIDGDQAEMLNRQALEIIESVTGPNNPSIVGSLLNLANYSYIAGRSHLQEPLIQRALSILKSHDDRNNGAHFNLIASLYEKRGEYQKSAMYCQQAISEYGKTESNLTQIAYCKNKLAKLYIFLKEDYYKSNKLFRECHDIFLKEIDKVFAFNSEKTKTMFLSGFLDTFYVYFSFVSQYLSYDIVALTDVADVWLKYKGIILDAQRRFRYALLYSKDVEIQNIFEKYKGVCEKLSNIYSALLFSEQVETLPLPEKLVEELTQEKEDLESALSRKCHHFFVSKEISKASIQDLLACIPSESVLIDFAKIPIFNFENCVSSRPHYFVFVIRNNGIKIQLVDLGDADHIENLVSKLKREIMSCSTGSNRGSAEEYFLHEDAKKQEQKVHKYSHELYNLIFRPISDKIGGVKKILISPDGELDLIPFEILIDAQGNYLIDLFAFNYIDASREIVGFSKILGEPGKTILIGNPNYDMDIEDTSSDHGSFSFSRPGNFKEQFYGLPETEEEVLRIHDILGKEESNIYTGSNAQESVLMEAMAPRILHLATHGFFLENKEYALHNKEDKKRGASTMPPLLSDENRHIIIDNPLLRSGIVLAGANKSLNKINSEVGEGVVTAEKILNMKLHGTEMVVLSACETGLGDIKTGEGVYGLRRAFAQAGAKSVVMSMWKVPDKETKELMIAFYRNLSKPDMDRCEALREAIVSTRERVKEKHYHTHPFFWGAFLFAGDPTPGSK